MKAASEIGQVLQDADKIKQGIDDLLKYVYQPEIGVSFDLPKDTVLVKEEEVGKWFPILDFKHPAVLTTERTTIDISATETGVSVSVHPFIFVDMKFPVNNVIIRGVSYAFSTKKISVDAQYAPLLNLKGVNVSALPQVKDDLTEKVSKIFADTPILNSIGYNPLKDADILKTITKIYENVSKL